MYLNIVNIEKGRFRFPKVWFRSRPNLKEMEKCIRKTEINSNADIPDVDRIKSSTFRKNSLKLLTLEQEPVGEIYD